jgi:CubicO group peptidase (beta-lactamase class C family)
MKTLIIILFAFGIIQSASSQKLLSKKLDEAITTYVMCNKFNGSVLVAQKGKILLEKGYGLKNVTDQTLNDTHTIFQVGSITKEFTAAIILKLASEKQLSLSDPLSKYYAEFPNGDSITIENLLSQSSGIFNYTDINDFWTRSGKPAVEQSVIDTIKKRPLLFTPGSKFSYSNSNYMLLAYIIQKVTGKPYEMVVRERIFKPLDMSYSGFDFTGLKNPDKAKGYWDFTAMKTTEGPLYDSSEFTGSGNLYSTVRDLYKWHQALQEGRILTPKLQEQAYLPRAGQYGYGWELDTIYGKKIVGHGGRMFGFESKMIRIPEDDVFVVLLNNSSDGPYLRAIARNILAILYGKPFDAPERPVQLTEEQLNAYIGRFGEDEQHTFEVRLVNGHLFGMESPQNALELLPLEGNRFHFMEHEGEEGILEFAMDEKGKAKEISTVNQRNGKKIILKKMN